MLNNLLAEVVRAMTYVIQQGYSMYWGTSRWSHCEVCNSLLNTNFQISNRTIQIVQYRR